MVVVLEEGGGKERETVREVVPREVEVEKRERSAGEGAAFFRSSSISTLCFAGSCFPFSGLSFRFDTRRNVISMARSGAGGSATSRCGTSEAG